MCLGVTRYSTLKTKYVKKNESCEFLRFWLDNKIQKWYPLLNIHAL